MLDTSTMNINGGTISGNTSGNAGGGIWAGYSSAIIMKNGSIINNSCVNKGGGVTLAGSTFTISGGTVNGTIYNGD